MNDIASMPPSVTPTEKAHFRKTEILIFGMTRAEEAEFIACERTIKRGPKDFYPVGRALARIQSARLYRSKYKTFNDYCREQWGFSRIRAYQLISASERYEWLQALKGITLPSNESQLRALMKVPEQDVQQVWKEFVASHGPGEIRAKHVETFVTQRYGGLPRRKRGRGKASRQSQKLRLHLGMIFEMANLIRELNYIAEEAPHNLQIRQIARKLKACSEKLQEADSED